MQGILGELVGIPIIESKSLREGTYMCMDENGLPIKQSDLGKVEVSKILVHDVESFKIAIKNNQEKGV